MYEAAVSENSPVFAALMTGAMSESVSGEVIWGDLDKDIFLRFIRFTYTGDYSVSNRGGSRLVGGRTIRVRGS